MTNYRTLSEAVNSLTRKGYIYNFNIKPDCLECIENKVILRPTDFEIDEIHRFEGMNDPGDSNILYAISSYDQKLKGLLVDAYGVYSDSFSAEMVSKLKI
jgi:hypothetical protein